MVYSHFKYIFVSDFLTVKYRYRVRLLMHLASISYLHHQDKELIVLNAAN